MHTRVQCYHRVGPFHGHTDMASLLWDGHFFAFKGGVFCGQIATVSWERVLTIWHDWATFDSVCIGTTAHIDEMLASSPGVPMVVPFDKDNNTTEVVRVRRTVYLHPKLVPIALRRDLTIRQACEQISGATVAGGKEKNVSSW